MLISTKGRYAIRVMLDLAQHKEKGFIPMKEVAERQGLSLKYMERIMPALSKNNLVEGIHGKGGGYRLAREPKDCKIGEILRLTEGNLAPVTCLESSPNTCKRAKECKTLFMWEKFYELTTEYFDGITLENLL